MWKEPGLTVLVLITVLWGSGFMALLAVGPMWAVHGGAGKLGSGSVTSAFAFSALAVQSFVPGFIRRWGGCRLLVAGLLLLGSPSMLLAISDHLAPVLALTAVRGTGLAVVAVASGTVLVELIPESRRGAATGAWGLGMTIPSLLILPISVTMADQIGYAWVFGLAAVPLLGIPLVLRLEKILQRQHHATQSPVAPGSIRQLARHVARPTLTNLAIAATVSGGLTAFLPQMVTSNAQSSIALFALGAAGAVGRWRIGTVADRVGAHRLLRPGLACLTIAFMLTAIALHGGTTTWLLMTAMIIAGLAFGALQSVTLIDTFAKAPPRMYSSASAAWNIAGNTGFGLGGLIVGAIAASHGFTVCLIVCTVIVAAALLMREPRR